MGLKKILLATAAMAVLASPALAGDRKGWYVGLSAGLSIVEDFNDVGTANDINFDNGYAVFGSLGYAFAGPWRLEAELGYRDNDAVLPGFTKARATPLDGELSELSLMGNLAWDVSLGSRWILSPLVGVGVDRATLETNLPTPGDDRDYVFAYQAGADLTFMASAHWDMFVSYRYFVANDVTYAQSALGVGNTGDIQHDYTKHSIAIGLRYGYDEPAAPPAPPPPPPPPPAIKQFIVFFGFNKYNLTSEAQAVVAEAASAAKSQGAASIIVVGHTDTVGGNAYNQRLSEKRAGAVKDELVRLGIDAGKITASGKGETELLVQTGDSVKEPQNRRATIDLK